MTRSLDRLAAVRLRLKRHAEAEHAQALGALTATQQAIDAAAAPPLGLVSGQQLWQRDETSRLLWEAERQQREACQAARTRLLHEVGEHKKVEKILEARRLVETRRRARREAESQDAWLRNRLFVARRRG